AGVDTPGVASAFHEPGHLIFGQVEGVGLTLANDQVGRASLLLHRHDIAPGIRRRLPLEVSRPGREAAAARRANIDRDERRGPALGGLRRSREEEEGAAEA